MHCGGTAKAHERHATFSLFKHRDFLRNLYAYIRDLCARKMRSPRDERLTGTDSPLTVHSVPGLRALSFAE